MTNTLTWPTWRDSGMRNYIFIQRFLKHQWSLNEKKSFERRDQKLLSAGENQPLQTHRCSVNSGTGAAFGSRINSMSTPGRDGATWLQHHLEQWHISSCLQLFLMTKINWGWRYRGQESGGHTVKSLSKEEMGRGKVIFSLWQRLRLPQLLPSCI